jgi:hypothetical protein
VTALAELAVLLLVILKQPLLPVVLHELLSGSVTAWVRFALATMPAHTSDANTRRDGLMCGYLSAGLLDFRQGRHPPFTTLEAVTRAWCPLARAPAHQNAMESMSSRRCALAITDSRPSFRGNGGYPISRAS